MTSEILSSDFKFEIGQDLDRDISKAIQGLAIEVASLIKKFDNLDLMKSISQEGKKKKKFTHPHEIQIISCH